METNSLPNTICPPPLFYRRLQQDDSHKERNQLDLSTDLSQSHQHFTNYDPAATSLHWTALMVPGPATTTAGPRSEEPERARANPGEISSPAPLLKALAEEILSLSPPGNKYSDCKDKSMQTEVFSLEKSGGTSSQRRHKQNSYSKPAGTFVRDCCSTMHPQEDTTRTTPKRSRMEDMTRTTSKRITSKEDTTRTTPKRITSKEDMAITTPKRIASKEAKNPHKSSPRVSKTIPGSTNIPQPLQSPYAHACATSRQTTPRLDSKAKSRRCKPDIRSYCHVSSDNSKSRIVVHMPKVGARDKGNFASTYTVMPSAEGKHSANLTHPNSDLPSVRCDNLDENSSVRLSSVTTIMNEMDEELAGGVTKPMCPDTELKLPVNNAARMGTNDSKTLSHHTEKLACSDQINSEARFGAIDHEASPRSSSSESSLSQEKSSSLSQEQEQKSSSVLLRKKYSHERLRVPNVNLEQLNIVKQSGEDTENYSDDFIPESLESDSDT